MVSRDAQRTLGFYRDLLGLPMVKRTVNFDDPSSYHLYFGQEGGAPGTILTFFEWPHSRPGGWGVGGIHHLALAVESPEAQLMWKRRLSDAGVNVTGPFDRGYFKSIYFRDPDGQVLEIATDGPGYAIDEPADALGKTLITPDSARLPGGRGEEQIAKISHPDPVEEITKAMRLSGIHHITGITDNLQAAGAFYEEALGLKLVKQTFNQDDGKTEHYFWANYDGQTVAPRSSFTLFGWPSSTYRSRPGSGQTHHVAFRAKTEAEQLAWREQLVGLGIRVSPVMDRKYFKSIYFQAPDGFLVEIATDGPGFTVDEALGSLGTGLQLPSWMEEGREGIESGLTPLEAAVTVGE
jgi:glyoxalase family protein